jgi:hypothetical protein
MIQSTDELPVRAVKAKGWEWRPGMKIFHIGRPFVVVSVIKDEWLGEPFTVLEAISWVDLKRAEIIVRGETFPDLDDDGTKGHMLARVRQVWGSPYAHARLSTTTRQSDGKMAWEMESLYFSEKAAKEMGVSPGSVRCWGFLTEEEALVFALENCP